MAINVSVQFNGGFPPDIILLTQCYLHHPDIILLTLCYYHWGTRLNAVRVFVLAAYVPINT